MGVVEASSTRFERTPCRCDCCIASRRRAHRSTTRISCRTPGWSRSWPSRERAGLAGPGCGARPSGRRVRRQRAPEGAVPWSRAWRPARTRIDDMGLLRHGAMSTLFGGDPRAVHAGLAPALLYLGKRRASWRRPAGSSWRSCPGGRRCCPARTRWRSLTSTRCRSGSTGIRSRARGSGIRRSRLRHEAPCHIPGVAGRNSEGGSASRTTCVMTSSWNSTRKRH